MKTNEIAKIIETDPQTIFYTKNKYGLCSYYRITNTIDEINNGHINRKGFKVQPMWIGWNRETNSHVVTTMTERYAPRVQNFRITGVFATTEQEAIERLQELEQKRAEQWEQMKAEAEAADAKRKEMQAFGEMLAETLDLDPYFVGFSVNNNTYQINITPEKAAALVARLNGTAV